VNSEAAMYTKFYGLEEEPFSTTTNPKYLYRSKMHQQALDRLVAAVSERRGINAIIGEPGLGKSTLIRTLLSGFSSNIQYAWVFNTTLDARELLKYICRDFGFSPQGKDQSDLLMELYAFLIDRYEQGKYTLLVIDEAQNLKHEVLEQVRQLSNLETSRRKLLQVILSGQPQLDVHLDHPDLFQLKQRISFKSRLYRMNLEDTREYIQFRLNKAAAKKENLFSQAALELIYEFSDGVPRIINQICENALMTAAENKETQIQSSCIKSLLEEGKITPVKPALGSDHREDAESDEDKAKKGSMSKIENFELLDIGELSLT
jgi:general secretion pathway protein A